MGVREELGCGNGRGRSRCSRDAHISKIEIWGTRVLRGRREASRGVGENLLGLGEEGEDFGLRLGVVDAEEGVGDGEVEAAGAGAAWIEVEDALAVLGGGFVGVAVEDDSDAGGFGFEVQLVEGVEHVDQAAG